MQIPGLQAASALAFPEVAQRARRWLGNSGIQKSDGGVGRYYRGDTRTALPVSTEITGYALRGLLPSGHDAALRAGDFLIDTVWDSTLRIFPFELEGPARSAYFFDTGIVARGLLDLWRVTGDERWLHGSVAAADSMIGDFTAPRGYHPILELPSKQPRAYEIWWSKNPGAFHLKAALIFHELAAITQEPRFEEHYQRALAFSLENQQRLLADETDELKVMDRLHAYCYFLEGLMPEALRHAAVIAAGIEEVHSRRSALEERFVRSDVFAQLLRVRLLAHNSGACPLDEKAAQEEATELATFQIESGDPRLDGAFAFGRRDGRLILHANPVSTVFAVQALDWWQQFEEGRFSARSPELI